MSQNRIAAVSNGTQAAVQTNDTMSAAMKLIEDMKAQMAAQAAEIAALKAARPTGKLTVKANLLGNTMSDGKPCKGNVGVYGLNGKYPVTLYASQWERLFEAKDEILKVIADNKARLSHSKGESE